MLPRSNLSCCSSYLYLLFVIIKLKGWRLLLMALVLAAITSNLYLYKPIDSWMMHLIDDGLKVVGPTEFYNSAIVIADKVNDKAKLEIISGSFERIKKTNFMKDIVENCEKGASCQDKYFQMLLGKRPGKIAHYVEYQGRSAGPQIKCQLSLGFELYCPLMAYMAVASSSLDKGAIIQYNSSYTFSLKSSTKVFGSISRGEGTLCQTDRNFPSVFPRAVMAQLICVAIVLNFYLVVTAIFTIHDLKQHGFLQLLFRRGLSVLAYWCATWTIIMLEMVIFAAALTLSYYFQCIGFYPPIRLVFVFLCAFAQFCCVAAFVLLFSVLTRRVVIVCILTSVFCFIVVASILVNRIMLFQQKGAKWPKYIILAVPFGHIVEQIYAELLKDDLQPADSFLNLVLPASFGIFALLVIVTIYLDYVLKSGSGLHYPNAFMFYSRFWSIKKSDLQKLSDPPPHVMVETVTFGAKPMLCTSGLKKYFGKRCQDLPHGGLKSFSEQFHEEHITAIVGHNGSGKSVLMQLLAGERLPTKGKATLNNLPITDPLCRSHIAHDIGYCPQSDALVDSLTVWDMVKMSVYSSGLSWNDCVQVHVNRLLAILQLDSKVSNTIHSLPSSDKRKVSVAMALVGKPRVILLDQPTRDMDYITKRRMWKLLYECKKGRVIIFSTHFIDEADGMADRMIFMSGGRKICGGSSFFFKRAFDCRYIIRIVSKTEFHVPQIGRRITNKFSSIRVRSIGRADLELEVSLLEDHILPAVVAEVESLIDFIDKFGIVHHSLDDVFSKLKPLSQAEVEAHLQSGTIGYLVDDLEQKEIQKNTEDSASKEEEEDEPLAPSKIMTIWAMLVVNALQIKRSPTKFVIRVVVPIVLLVLLIIGAVFERRANNHKVAVKFDLSDTRAFEHKYGLCFFIYPGYSNNQLPGGGHKHDRITDLECMSMISGRSTDPTEVKVKQLGITRTIFKDVIMEPQNIEEIEKVCRMTEAPCPVLYSTKWCGDFSNPVDDHNVYVGVYVRVNKYSPIDIAMTLIEAYRNVFNRSTTKYNRLASIAPGQNLNPKVRAEGNLDIKAIFFPLYGLFVQIIILAIMPAIHLNDVIEDKSSGVYDQLVSMSVSHFHYWICTFFHHWIQLAVVYILSTLILIIIVTPGYSNAFYLVFVFLPTLLLGLTNSLLFIYVLSVIIHKVSYLFIVFYACFSLLASLAILPAQANDLVGQILLAVLPQCAIVAPTYYGARFIHYSLSYFKPTDAGVVPNLLSYVLVVGHVRDALMALMAHCILFSLLLVLIESWGYIKKCCCPCKKPETDEHPHAYKEDAAISEAVDKIATNPKCDENVMEATCLKVRNSYHEHVLKDLTIGMKRGEVFGLLGPCGSGNGAALKAIVGSKKLTSGQVKFHVHDEWLSSGKAARRCFIGYCPREDPLIDMLTVKENLEFYSRSIGHDPNRVDHLLRKFRLEDDVHTIACHATAGVKRRLSLAIAVLPSPWFIAIDQASAGVDPEGRKILWQTIKSLASKERSIIVATQEIEEAEKLCGRICVMNQGLMAALNSVDDLTKRYKKMYFLEIQLGDTSNATLESIKARKAELTDLIQKKFEGVVVIEKLALRIQFGIPITSVGRLSSTVSWLLDRKRQQNLLYFAIHLATIDQAMKAIVANHEQSVHQDELEDSAWEVEPVRQSVKCEA